MHKFLLILLSSTTISSAAEPRNVLVILADDMGFGHLSSFMELHDRDKPGSERGFTAGGASRDELFDAAKRATPNLDGLAKRGIRFTNFRTAAVCAPTRTMLMTARYPQRMGVFSNLDINVAGVPAKEHFFVKDLKQAGYHNGIVGKWHLGSKRGQTPNERGFDYFWGFDGAQTEKYDSKKLVENGKKVAAEGWLADQMTDKAIAFLADSRTQKKPFFLYLAYNEPHAPNPRPPEAYNALFKTGNKKTDQFYAQLHGMDTGIGRVLKDLEENGELERTLIVFFSDNGATEEFPPPGNGPFRGYKRTILDGGVRTPLVVFAPGSPLLGKTVNESVSVMDLMPTFLDFAGIKPPEHPVDGRSVNSLLAGKVNELPKRILFDGCATSGMSLEAPRQQLFSPAYPAYLARDQQAVLELKEDGKSKGSGRWAYERSPASYFAIEGKWKLFGTENLPTLLFDLESDPAERKDVGAENPEVRDRLLAAYSQWIKGMPAAVAWGNERRNLLNK